jgi:hydroxymethylglutaryl-CoA synthase
MKPSDFGYAVFHMPNGKFPKEVAVSLGFNDTQLKDSLPVTFLGNSYTASALMGLMSVFDSAQSGDLIFLASYGSGAGSDVFILRITDGFEKKRLPFKTMLKQKTYISYPTYLKYMKNIG